MKNTPEEVLKSIPDFDDFMKLTDEITQLMWEKLTLEAQLKEGEANVFKRAFSEERFFQGGKPPSAAFVDNTYKHSGLDGELLPLRNSLASIVSKLDGKRLKMDVYKTMIEVWRTLCSNQRTAGLA